MQGTILEERMAGNMYDRNLAFQAAEAALRAGENDVADGFGDPAEMATWYDATSNAAPAGLDDDANWPDGAFEYADALAGLSQAPEYIIEVQRTLPPLEADAPVELPLVRVSARGTGRNGTSVVVLQSIYKP